MAAGVVASSGTAVGIAAVATLLTLFTTALMLTLEWLRGRRK